MSKKHSPEREVEPPPPNAPPAAVAASDALEASPVAAATPPEAVASAADELTVLRREVEELRDKHLRLVAELQNQHKRAQREKSDALRYAEFAFAQDLLVVLDDLERTQEAARSAADAQTLSDGVRIIYEHFLKVLRNREIQPIEAVGRPFDPTYHEALLQQPSPDQPAGSVLQELTRGYTMHERVLRPARVIVSIGSPAGGEPVAAPSQAGEPTEPQPHQEVN